MGEPSTSSSASQECGLMVADVVGGLSDIVEAKCPQSDNGGDGDVMMSSAGVTSSSLLDENSSNVREMDNNFGGSVLTTEAPLPPSGECNVPQTVDKQSDSIGAPEDESIGAYSSAPFPKRRSAVRVVLEDEEDMGDGDGGAKPNIVQEAKSAEVGTDLVASDVTQSRVEGGGEDGAPPPQASGSAGIAETSSGRIVKNGAALSSPRRVKNTRSGRSSSASSSSGSSSSSEGSRSRSNGNRNNNNSTNPNNNNTNIPSSNNNNNNNNRRRQGSSSRSSSTSSSGGSSSSGSSSGSSRSSSSSGGSSDESDGSSRSDSSAGSGKAKSKRTKNRAQPKSATRAQSRKGGASPKRPSPKKKSGKRPYKSVTGDDSSDDTDSGSERGAPHPKRPSGDPKAELVSQVLARWWYCLPPWPPEDYSYEAVLQERKLRWVDLEDWEDLDEMNAEGFTKVYQVSHYPGVFRDPTGQAIDLRPLEGKPCYSELVKRSEDDLAEMLVRALTKQLEELEFSPFWNSEKEELGKLQSKLKKSLADAKVQAEKLRRRKEYLQQRRGA